MRLRKLSLLGLSLAAMFAVSTASAQVRYEANLSVTNAKAWSVRASKISCILSYNIEGYGRADFTLLSGSERLLSLELFPFVEVTARTKMRIISAPPEWKPHGVESVIGEIGLFRGFRPFVGDSVSWGMLRELSRGQRILMPYMNDRKTFKETMVPVLSPLGFMQPYSEFTDCSSQLLNIGFGDVELIALMFFEQTDKLTPTSESRIKDQIKYAKLDPAINKIIITAFGSGNLDNLDNLELAKQRGDTLSKIFTDAGIDKNLIEIRTYGDEQLASTGYTAAERQQSSKAIIKLERDPFKVDHRLEVDMPDIGVPEELQ